MADSKVSIFDFGQITEQFWQPCEKSILDTEMDLMEHQFMIQNDMKIVPIYLLLGTNHLYKVTEDKLKWVPLTTTQLQIIDLGSEHFVQLNTEEPQHGFRLTFRCKAIEIFTSDKYIYDEWKKQLKMKCLLDDFHVQYIVQKMIGKGSFAKVYLATKKENGQQYAIKAFSKAFMQQQHKGLESLVNEMEIMRKVSHPNILKLYEVHETENSVYFIVEVISGGELLQRVRETGFLSNDSLQKLAFNLLAALNHLHMQKIAHRDLKPENLLLRSKENSYEIIIADFGLAGIMGTDLLFKRCGTPGFVAPEILEFYEGMEMYNEKCDVFSAGVILYILITGTQPFAGKDQKSILKANKDCLVDYGDTLFKNAPSQLQDLVKLMLARNPQNRQSAQQCLQHPYFKQLLKERQNQLPIFQQKLEIYDNYKNALKAGSMVSSIEQRSPQYNGQMGTVGSISSNVSIPKEQRNQQQQAISKFSQYSNKLQKSQSGSKRDLTLSDVIPVTKTESKRQIDLHRIAIKNNMSGYQRKDLVLDQFEDVPVQSEQSQVGEMIKMYNSTRIINIPKLQNKKPTTPTSRKQDIS